MSVLDFLRTTSGLLIPYHMMASKWKWLGCWDGCCDGETGTGTGTGTVIRSCEGLCTGDLPPWLQAEVTASDSLYFSVGETFILGHPPHDYGTGRPDCRWDVCELDTYYRSIEAGYSEVGGDVYFGATALVSNSTCWNGNLAIFSGSLLLIGPSTPCDSSRSDVSMEYSGDTVVMDFTVYTPTGTGP